MLIEGVPIAWAAIKQTWKLSDARAKSVREYLIKKGVSADRLTAQGFGESRPVDSNKTRKGRANNRRVEFKIQKPPKNLKQGTNEATEDTMEKSHFKLSPQPMLGQGRSSPIALFQAAPPQGASSGGDIGGASSGPSPPKKKNVQEMCVVPCTSLVRTAAPLTNVDASVVPSVPVSIGSSLIRIRQRL